MLLTCDIRICILSVGQWRCAQNFLQKEIFVSRLGTIPMLCRISDCGDSASPTLVSWYVHVWVWVTGVHVTLTFSMWLDSSIHLSIFFSLSFPHLCASLSFFFPFFSLPLLSLALFSFLSHYPLRIVLMVLQKYRIVFAVGTVPLRVIILFFLFRHFGQVRKERGRKVRKERGRKVGRREGGRWGRRQQKASKVQLYPFYSSDNWDPAGDGRPLFCLFAGPLSPLVREYNSLRPCDPYL